MDRFCLFPLHWLYEVHSTTLETRIRAQILARANILWGFFGLPRSWQAYVLLMLLIFAVMLAVMLAVVHVIMLIFEALALRYDFTDVYTPCPQSILTECGRPPRELLLLLLHAQFPSAPCVFCCERASRRWNAVPLRAYLFLINTYKYSTCQKMYLYVLISTKLPLSCTYFTLNVDKMNESTLKIVPFWLWKSKNFSNILEALEHIIFYFASFILSFNRQLCML